MGLKTEGHQSDKLFCHLMCTSLGERESVCVCVRVRERKRERDRERASVQLKQNASSFSSFLPAFPPLDKKSLEKKGKRKRRESVAAAVFLE